MSIDNTDDTIDSRDVIARIDELAEERDALQGAIDAARAAETAPLFADAGTGTLADASAALAAWDDDYNGELCALKALAAEGASLADWRYGVTLVRDSYFRDYAQELAEDIGALPRDASWPACHIDWDAAADALQADYTSLDYDGVTYWAHKTLDTARAAVRSLHDSAGGNAAAH